MVGEVADRLGGFEARHGITAEAAAGAVQLLGTSGTVTTLAGMHLALPRYRRDRVDGVFLYVARTLALGRELAGMSFEERAAQPCIGRERADRWWPAARFSKPSAGPGRLRACALPTGV